MQQASALAKYVSRGPWFKTEERAMGSRLGRKELWITRSLYKMLNGHCDRNTIPLSRHTPLFLQQRNYKDVSTLLPVMLQIRVPPASTTDSDYLTHYSDYTLWRRMDLLGNDIRMISEDPLCIRQITLGHQKWYFAIQHNKLWCSDALLVPMNCNQDKWNSMAFHTITGIKQSFQ